MNGQSSSSGQPSPPSPPSPEKSGSSPSSSSSSDSLFDDNEEVDQLLESYVEKTSNQQPSHIEKIKIVLKKRGQDYFEVLPEGWIEVTHSSGMPLYLHKQSRVCTMSKPYYLGSGSVRRHEIPISAIPCLQYRKELEKEKTQDKKDKQDASGDQLEQTETNNPCDPDTVEHASKRCKFDDANDEKGEVEKPDVQNPSEDQGEKDEPTEQDDPTEQQDGNIGLETVQDHKREKWLGADDVRNYCVRLFDFVEIKIRKFKTWADRRKHNSIIREQRQRPSLSNDTKLITCSSSTSTTTRKDFVMNPAGKSSVCILHEFVQHRDKVQPKYIYKELENSTLPYKATAQINGRSYGEGLGKSKKDAKEEAARKTMELFLPGVTGKGSGASGQSSEDIEFFENIKIDDNRVAELTSKAGLQSPYQILVECLKRKEGTCDTAIGHNVQLIRHHKNIYTMTASGQEAKVECKNKREGKQMAAQVILMKLHPGVKTWGGLLRMYGRGSFKTPKEKKEEEQKITELQTSGSPNRPNYAILEKLKEEMRKLNGSEVVSCH